MCIRDSIYFERAIANFISFLNHHEYSPEQVREVLNDVERECIVSHGYGLHSFSHALVQTFERLAVEPLTPALHETISGFAHAIAEHPVEILNGVPCLLYTSMLRPVRSQRLHHPGMSNTDCSLENQQELRREPRPALSQNQIVGVFDVQAGDAVKHIQRGEHFLHIQKTDFPRPVLHCQSGLQSVGCTAVPSTRVVENDRQLAQASPDRALPGQPGSAANIFVFCIFR